jgi:hypothetical protein
VRSSTCLVGENFRSGSLHCHPTLQGGAHHSIHQQLRTGVKGRGKGGARIYCQPGDFLRVAECGRHGESEGELSCVTDAVLVRTHHRTYRAHLRTCVKRVLSQSINVSPRAERQFYLIQTEFISTEKSEFTSLSKPIRLSGADHYRWWYRGSQ